MSLPAKTAFEAEVEPGYVFDDFTKGDRVYLRGYQAALRSVTVPHFGTVLGSKEDDGKAFITIRLDTKEKITIPFPLQYGTLGKILPLKLVAKGDTISHLDFNRNRVFYTVKSYVPDEFMALEEKLPGNSPAGKLPHLLTILRDYSTPGLEDDFLDWELEA